MTEDLGAGWHRLHPLSPLIQGGGLLSGLLGIFALSLVTAEGYEAYVYQLVAVAAIMVAGLVRWLVTRWKLDGATLRIETGLLRRDSRQLPMTRIQAVDVVRPLLARVFGLASLQIRLAGAAKGDDRLAYLTLGEAARLRAVLLAGHHGLDPAAPEPAERPVITVPAGRVIGATLLRAAPRFMALAAIAAAAAAAAPALFPASDSTLAVIALGLVTSTCLQLTARYGFTVATSHDEIRIRRGLLSTVVEAIPLRRVQAVRLVQPLLWRPFGWCRLVVHVAGVAGRDSGPKAGGLTKALLPVGSMTEAQHLIRLVFGPDWPELARPPKRAGQGTAELPLPRRRAQQGDGRNGHRPGVQEDRLHEAGETAERPAEPRAGAAQAVARLGARRRRRAAGACGLRRSRGGSSAGTSRRASHPRPQCAQRGRLTPFLARAGSYQRRLS